MQVRCFVNATLVLLRSQTISVARLSPDVELIPQAFTAKFTLRLSAAHVAEWVRQLHVDPVVPVRIPQVQRFFSSVFSSIHQSSGIKGYV